jgi:hypothetical protein
VGVGVGVAVGLLDGAMIGLTAIWAVAVDSRSRVWLPKNAPRKGVSRTKSPATETWITLPSASAQGSGSQATATSAGVIVSSEPADSRAIAHMIRLVLASQPAPS